MMLKERLLKMKMIKKINFQDEDYPLWAFSLPVFKFFKFNDKIGSDSNKCLIIFDDNEEQRCWLKIEEKLKAIAEFQKNSPKK